jgi:hypothetical protein
MARNFSLPKIIGILLLVAGIVVLIIGIYQFVEFRQSIGGKLAGGANKFIKAFGGGGKMARGYTQPIILMISGAIGAVAGGFITVKS